MKHFTIEELCHSDTAIKKGLSNSPASDARWALETLVNKLLDPVREKWGKPIVVNGGFRGPILNKLVGGAASSQHTLGEAADITTGSPAGNKTLFDMIVASGLDFDQLIDEKNYTWLHVSYRTGRNRKQILHL